MTIYIEIEPTDPGKPPVHPSCRVPSSDKCVRGGGSWCPDEKLSHCDNRTGSDDDDCAHSSLATEIGRAGTSIIEHSYNSSMHIHYMYAQYTYTHNYMYMYIRVENTCTFV